MSSITQYVIRNKQYAISLTHYLRLHLDTFIGLILFSTGLYAYTITLAPTVLEGDGALFQYTPHVLGVTYPTGFPLYILIGKLWLTIFPFGEIAWRMNFLSALCSATTLPLIYGATRRLFGAEPQSARWAALATALTFATLPTFWLWSTSTKTYALNILLFTTTLYLLVINLNRKLPTDYALRSSPLRLPALLLGLQISVHNTAVLLIPGLFLLVWLHFRQYLRGTKSLLTHLALLALPGLFYLYIPLRAEWFIARYGRTEAIERGLIADFYHSGGESLLRYFTAADFTGGVVTNWGLVPQQFFTRYLPILTDNFTWLGVGLGVIGGIALAILKPRLFWPLFLIYAVPIPFVLAYGQGEQSAFLLPSFLIFSIFLGYSLTIPASLLNDSHQPTPQASDDITSLRPTSYVLRTTHHVSPFTFYASRFIAPLLFTILLIFLFLPQIRYNFNWLDVKWSRPIYDEWIDNLNHPLEENATILARWGDLTSFWYMQYAETRRPDLRGLYPPTEETVIDWFKRGGENLYIAGPLERWAAGVEERYQLLPWGRLVRIAPRQVEPGTLLPDLPHTGQVVFNDKLRLIGFDYAPQVTHGSDYPVILTWQTLIDLPPETTISLRLSQNNAIITQLDDTLLSGWFPRETLPAGQYVLSYTLLPIPLGTLPGKYDLQLVTYTNYKQPWTMPDGTTILKLGQVEVTLPPATYQPDAETFHTVPGHDFDGEIRLADYEYSVSRVGQGKGFAVKLLWQVIKQPVDNYTLLVEVVDAAGNVLHAVERQPVEGQAPTSTWQTGQFVRDQVDVVIPASAPAGEEAIRVRLSWLRPDSTRLSVRRWHIPFSDALSLDRLAVTEKEGRVFDLPARHYPIEANLENKVRLLGYDTPNLEPQADNRPIFTVSQANCQETADACQLDFDFYWQGLSEMEQLYFVFLHVVDEQGHIITQHDRSPGIRGKQPTTSWLPGEVVTDPVTLHLPPETSPGTYTLHLGMYLPPEGPRLLVVDDSGQAITDFVEISTVEIKP